MTRQTRMWIGSLALVVISAFAVATAVRGQYGQHIGPKLLLEFQTMIGNDPDQTINGIESDELPWDIYHSAQGHLLTNGEICLKIRGLVFANDPSVPPELRGTNDSPTFTAVLSCFTTNSEGELVVANVATKAFPATTHGNSTILDKIEVPNPCIAPMIFILGDEGLWFAVTGVGD